MDTTIFHGEVSGIDEITAPLLLPEGIVSEMINLHLDRSGESGFPPVGATGVIIPPHLSA